MKAVLHTLLYMGLVALASCTQDMPTPTNQGRLPLSIGMEHPTATRATATAFETGDVAGVYVVADTATLQAGGNTVTNEPLTCAGEGKAWTSRTSLFWDEGRYSIYAYYPHQGAVESVSDMPFGVRLDQSTARLWTTPGGYEASDLLWASAQGVQASAQMVTLRFRHVMSRLTIRLIKGEDFQGEMPTEAQVYVHGTVPEATVDLARGEATKYMYGREATIRAHQRSNYVYEAIVVPQRITRRRPLVEVVMKGVSYLYESNFVFKAGTDHLLNIVITDNPDKAIIDVGGEIKGW